MKRIHFSKNLIGMLTLMVTVLSYFDAIAETNPPTDVPLVVAPQTDAPKAAAPPTEKIKDLRTKAKQLRTGHSTFVMVTSDAGSDVRTVGETVWRAPAIATADFKVEGVPNSHVIAVWEEDSYREYDLRTGEVTEINLETLRGEFSEDTLRHCGLNASRDPFQGLREATVEFLREEKIGGEPAFVFEGEMWPQYSEEQPVRQKERLWVGADDGLVRQAEILSPDGKRVAIQTFTIKEKHHEAKTAAEARHPSGKFLVTDKTKETADWLKLHYGKEGLKK